MGSLFEFRKMVLKTKKRKSFKKQDAEFKKAQNEWEASNFSLNSKAWKTMWERVQHAVYNIIFKKLYYYKKDDEILSLSYEIASNIMQGFIKKQKKGKEWKVRGPLGGFCSSYCLVIYADRYKNADKELDLDVITGTSAEVYIDKNEIEEEEEKQEFKLEEKSQQYLLF